MGGCGLKWAWSPVSICCCTIGDAPPPLNLDSWLMCEGTGKELPQQFKLKAHDIYAIGSQVCIIILLDQIFAVINFC